MGDAVFEQLAAWRSNGTSCAVATVLETRRSAPRPVGAKLVLGADGVRRGGVSGGCVEAAVLEAANAMLIDGRDRLLRFEDHGEDLGGTGLPCGGEITVLLERCEPTDALHALAAGSLAGQPIALVTELDLEGRVHVRARAAFEGGAVHGGGKLALDEQERRRVQLLVSSRRSGLIPGSGRALFVDVAAPPPRLIVVGGGELGAALCLQAALAGFSCIIVEPRRALADIGLYADAQSVIAAWPQDALPDLEIGPDTAVVAISHDPKIDDPAVLRALASPAFFVGAIGSRRAAQRRVQRLLEAGAEPTALALLHSPVGLDLGGTTLAHTALSIVAEVVAALHGRAGGSLSTAHGPIHEPHSSSHGAPLPLLALDGCATTS